MSNFDLRHIARLSRLYFKDTELAIYESQVDGILKFVEQLNAVDVTNIEPTSHPLALENVFREDCVVPSLSVEEFLKHCPAAHGRFFEVPKVIEDKS
jgi:aspartyl-tRNA(Asn)/glutamyl-tRNA(Gln) amidotransferase subunit C